MNTLPSILFAGDPHGNFAPIVRAALRVRPAGVVLLGDYDLARPLDVEMSEVIDAGIAVHWIHGNHDTDRQDWFDRAFSSKLAGKNLHARVALIGGLVVAGLGGVFRRSAWPGDEKIAPGTPRKFDRRMELKHRSSIFPSDFEAIAQLKRVDVLVCHEAPAATHENGAEAIDRLIAKTKPRYVVHGHHHRDYRATIGDTIVVGVGKSGVADLQQTIVPGAGRSQQTRMKP
jgi:Icc-related predicted phosphoesterase